MKRLLFGLLALLLIALPQLPVRPVVAAPVQQAGCLYFTETGGGRGGFFVCDDAAARFRTAFQTWGLQRIGYPISRRYIRDGFVTQAYQKAIMQARPDQGAAIVLVNIFDDLHNHGFDEVLLARRQTPRQLPEGWDAGLTWQQIVERRQGLLNVRPALRAAYFSVSDPLTFFGLPTSEVQDMGNHYAVRLQRSVLQEWKENVPWARAGEVTIANGGDIAKELGDLPADAIVPEGGTPGPAPTTTPAPQPTTPAPAPTTPPPSGLPFTGSFVRWEPNCAGTQVKGRVTNAAGQPVPGVAVRVLLFGQAHGGPPRTNAAGEYEFNRFGTTDALASIDYSVAVVNPETGQLLSNEVSVRTDQGSCGPGGSGHQVATINFVRRD